MCKTLGDDGTHAEPKWLQGPIMKETKKIQRTVYGVKRNTMKRGQEVAREGRLFVERN